MKELSIEEKAKAYDEAIKYGQYLINERCKEGTDGSFYRSDLQKMFPELKEESEDEKIRKALITTVIHASIVYGATREEVLAWLEAQGKHAKFCDSIQVGDKVTRNQDDVLVNLSQLKRVAKPAEKEGEQNPTDEVKPKFKVGDWVTNGIDFTFQVRSIEDDMYLRSDDYFIDIETADTTFRLWTIQDAKDGDVLCVKYGNDKMPFIFTGKQDDIAYCALNSFGEFVLSMVEWLLNTSVLPATKEQRDLLFQKMKEAGYEWDAEKKELKKIEQKPVEPQQGMLSLEKYTNAVDECIYGEKSEWGDEDERNLQGIIDEIEANKNHVPDCDLATYDRFLSWLKSLKERVQPQPKQEWSEEDEKNLQTIQINVDRCTGKWDCCGEVCPISKCMPWLKSLRPQKQWKPSDEQIMYLSEAIDVVTKTEKFSIATALKELIEQLKKLRKE